MSKLKAWAVNYCGITQVTAAETKSRARYLSALAVREAGWVNSTGEAMVKLRSWRVPKYDAAAQAQGHEGAVPSPEDIPVPVSRDQELRLQLALAESRVNDLAEAKNNLQDFAHGLSEILHTERSRAERWKTRAVGWMKLSRHCGAAVVSRAEIADVEQAMLKAKVDKINMALYDARERAERWKTRAVNWMKTSRHCAAAKSATVWETKWNKLRKSALEAVLFFVELREKSNKQHKQELAEAEAALAKARAAERIAVEERKDLTKRLADMEAALRNKEALIEKLISDLNHANYNLKWADIELSGLRTRAANPGETITKLMSEMANQTLEMDALKDRIRKQRRVLLTASVFPGDLYSTAAGDEVDE